MNDMRAVLEPMLRSLASRDEALIDELGKLNELGGLPPVTPPLALRARLLQSIARANRFERFIPRVAELLDITPAQADARLRQLDDEASWPSPIAPGVRMLMVDRGAAVQGALTTFLCADAGATLPDHEHMGEEHALVLQGSCVSSHDGLVLQPGMELQMQAGSAHRLDVLPGPRCLLLVVSHGGVRLRPAGGTSANVAGDA